MFKIAVFLKIHQYLFVIILILNITVMKVNSQIKKPFLHFHKIINKVENIDQ